MAPRVVVFLDEQNVYRGARRAFFDFSDHYSCGNFHPMALGDLLISRLPHGVKEKRELVEVRLYTGTPNPQYDPKSHAAFLARSQAWQAEGATVVSRPLRYPTKAPPGEQKGVDVALAVDFVVMAVGGVYDIGIIFSNDTDLRPALEFVAARDIPIPEVACWWSDKTQSYLSINPGKVWSHRLSHDDYKAVADYTNYNH